MAFIPVELTKDGVTAIATTANEEAMLRWDGWLATGETSSVGSLEDIFGSAVAAVQRDAAIAAVEGAEVVNPTGAWNFGQTPKVAGVPLGGGGGGLTPAQVALLGDIEAATPANTPNTVVRRDGGGSFVAGSVYASNPINAGDPGTQLTRKDYVDNIGQSGSSFSNIVRRDEYGQSGFVNVVLTQTPTQPEHATRKDYVDGIGTPSAVANSIVRRGPSGQTVFNWTEVNDQVVYNAPTDASHATRKDYVDAGDAAAKARANHTGTQLSGTISDLTEAVQDIVGAFLVAGTGVTVSYNDAAGTFTINATATGGTTDPEVVRDVIGTAMVAGSGIQITVNDAGDTITISSTAVLPTRQVITGTGLTGGGDLSADRTLAVAYGSTAGTAVQGNDVRVTADQAAATASIRSLGTGAQQAKPGAWTPGIADLPAGSTMSVPQNSPGGTWPNRPTSRTDITVIWVRTVSGSSDPAAATSPSLTGAYSGDVVIGV